LEEANIAFAKTHDLDELLQQAKAVEPAWSTLQADLDYLNDFSVLYRYPGSNTSKAVAKKAVAACRKVRRVIRTAFGLPV
jgi:hypothetical protein